MSTSATKTASMPSAKPAQPDELIGRVINSRFRIISVIARGGMGRVYRAEQVPLGRLVAVKTLDLRQEGAELDPQFQQRFFLEASIASKLQHPNTVTVFDYGRTADDLYFIAMELVEGRSLLNLIRAEAPLPYTRALHIALQIARSLREAHRLDVIHRDLKPGNVLLTKHGDEEDFVKVLDFGLVKHIESEADQELTKAGLFMGSPKYMAPEQIRGEQKIDGRADIYALGIVMYEMLSGRVPFERENTVKLLMAHLHEQPPPLVAEGVPASVTQLVMRMLAKDPAQRPASMDELIERFKSAEGMPTTSSGNFLVSQEVRVSRDTTAPGPTMPHVVDSTRPPAIDSRSYHLESGVIPHASQPSPVSGTARFDAPTAARASSNLLPKVAVLAALVIAGGFLALRFSERGGSLSVQPLGEATPTAPARTGPSQGGPVVEAPAHVVVRLNSVPTGATVSADGKVYGQTPADIEWWGDLAAAGRQITFEFAKDGYEKVTVVRTLQGDKLDVEATLPSARTPSNSAAPRHHRRPARRDEAEPGPSGPVVVPQSFKEDPY